MFIIDRIDKANQRLLTIMTNDEGSHKLPKLKGKINYKSWSALMKKTLKGREEWTYVNPDSVTSKTPIRAEAEAESAFNV